MKIKSGVDVTVHIRGHDRVKGILEDFDSDGVKIKTTGKKNKYIPRENILLMEWRSGKSSISSDDEGIDGVL